MRVYIGLECRALSNTTDIRIRTCSAKQAANVAREDMDRVMNLLSRDEDHVKRRENYNPLIFFTVVLAAFVLLTADS